MTQKESFITIVFFVFVIWFQSYDIAKWPVKLWDESRYALNAMDMIHSNNILVVTHEGSPDLFNTKPPLGVWLMAISIKLFGSSTLAIRLPSLLFGILTSIVVFFFCKKVTKSIIYPIISVCILCTSSGFLGYHVVRNGDFDSSLVFFFTCIFTLTINYLIIKDISQNIFIALTSLLICLSFLTKGVSILFITPFLIIIFILIKPKDVLKLKFYIIPLSFILIFVLYYFLREQLAPGYFGAVVEKEFLKVKAENFEWWVKPFEYYFLTLKNLQFNHYYSITLFICAYVFLFIRRIKTQQTMAYNTFIFTFIASVSFLTIISIPPVKLDWYDAPALPLLSILTTIGLFIAIDDISGLLSIKYPSYKVYISYACYLLISVYLSYSFITHFKTIKFSNENVYDMEIESYFLHSNDKAYFPICVYLQPKHDEHLDHIRVYQKMYPDKISLTTKDIFFKNQLILARKNELAKLEEKYDFNIQHSWKELNVLKITKKK
jgi:4-amino-4-deoxy-L-arabinose transferase-like glycosyltransferase